MWLRGCVGWVTGLWRQRVCVARRPNLPDFERPIVHGTLALDEFFARAIELSGMIAGGRHASRIFPGGAFR
ncbi:hypothetical protein MPC1_8170003 [Methylocella tundrae]|nr:hypothetical protein MPC1_8170003 [Methylocella tundrae]